MSEAATLSSYSYTTIVVKVNLEIYEMLHIKFQLS